MEAVGGRPHSDPTQLGPLVLAYIGDTVFDLYVRTKLVETTGLTAHGLHMAAAKKVCASAQAEAYRRVEGVLTEEEAAVFRRGRNGHMGTIPRNASIGDYRLATGVEAVVGWLYLRGDDGRLNELMQIILNDDTNQQSAAGGRHGIQEEQ
ncbi:MAG: Mini-ribonuclease 3 [Clostridiales bacterium]|nr:Mini-ribonuclease 3 [Clostridiales bacterium]